MGLFRKSGTLRVALVVLAALVALTLTTCGSGKRAVVQGFSPGSSPGTKTSPEGLDYQETVSLEDALAELAAYPCPAGVDPALFAELKDALWEALNKRTSFVGAIHELPSGDKAGRGDPALQSGLTTSNQQPTTGRFASTPPIGEDNRVDDLALTDNGDGTFTLSWHYRNLGDYDRNGIVGIEDIVPLAEHYNETWVVGEEDTLPAAIDGSGNGVVDIADITPIAVHYHSDVAGYSIAGADSSEGEFTDFHFALLPSPAEDEALQVETAPPENDFKYFAVRPFGTGGLTGELSNVVERNFAPVAIADAEPTAGKAPLTVTFTCSESYDRDGSVVKYEWDFDGDGVYDWHCSSPLEAQHTYEVEGNYEAVLGVGDNLRAAASASILITVGDNEPPVAVAEVVPAKGDVPLTVTFISSHSTDPDGEIVQYAWDFCGDGTYDWEGSAPELVEHTYEYFGTYNAKLEVTDEMGATDRATVTIEVNSPPVAHLVADPTEGNAPLLVNFDASGSMDFDGSIVRYEWDWETDGIWDFGSDAEPNASHVYESIGLHRVSVRVTDDDGSTSYSSVSIRVNHPPVAMLTADIVHGAGPLLVNFDASGSHDPDGTVEGYEWDWESDGTFDYDSDANPATQYTYDSSGTYSATVRVTDDDADWGTDSIIITVGEHEEQWVHTWGGSEYEYADDLALASSGSVYVVGYTKSFSAGDYDALLLKYDASGNLRWQRTWGGSEDDWGYGVDVDEYEDVYVTGRTSSFGGGFLLKYDSDGNLLWQKVCDKHGGGYALTVDGNGNIYVTGDIGDVVLLKYNPNGELLWHKVCDLGEGFEWSYGVTVDENGYVYVTGWHDYHPNRDTSIIALKYDSDGNIIWQTTWNGAYWEFGVSVAVDESGNVYITGERNKTEDWTPKDLDLILLKFDSNGDFLWSRVWDAEETDYDYGPDLVIDVSGDLYMTGRTGPHWAIEGALLLKFDTSGNLLWQKVWNTEDTSAPLGCALAADSSGNLFIAGGATNAYGSWLDANGEITTPSGTADTPDGTVSTPDSTVTSPEGTETSPEGVKDEGGGRSDALVMKLDPSEL